MGLTYLGGNKKVKMYLGSIPIYRMYLGSERIYPNAGTVTYHVDANVIYTEEINIEESILAPVTFTPQKSGYTFHGWRKDTTASASVLSNEIMTGDDVTLYAVFKKTITLSYNGNGNTGGNTASQSGTQYYNNGNYANPSFTISTNSFTRSYYDFVNWRMGSTSGTQYAPGVKVTLSASTIMYAMWTARIVSKTVTKSAKVAINNWNGVRTLVYYDGVVFVSNPSISTGTDDWQRVNQKTYCIIVANHATGGGEWDITVTARGNAYESSAASGIATSKGEFEAVIDNWSGGTKQISFGRTYKVPPLVNWYSPNPSSSALAEDWTINITNVTTTGFTISWGANTGGARHQLGWIAEGTV